MQVPQPGVYRIYILSALTSRQAKKREIIFTIFSALHIFWLAPPKTNAYGNLKASSFMALENGWVTSPHPGNATELFVGGELDYFQISSFIEALPLLDFVLSQTVLCSRK